MTIGLADPTIEIAQPVIERRDRVPAIVVVLRACDPLGAPGQILLDRPHVVQRLRRVVRDHPTELDLVNYRAC